MAALRFGVSFGPLLTTWVPDLPLQLAEVGVATVEVHPALLTTAGAPSAHALRALLAAQQITVSSVHAPFGADRDPSSLDPVCAAQGVASMQQSIVLAQALGAPLVVAHASYEPMLAVERPQRLAQAQHSLQELTSLLTTSGVRLAVEWLPRSCLGNTLPELLALISVLPEACTGVCLDTNHVMGRAGDLPQFVRTLGPRLIALHLADYDGVDEQHWLPGAGVIDWAACLAALDAIAYAGPWTYEWNTTTGTLSERLRALAANFAWLYAQQNGEQAR